MNLLTAWGSVSALTRVIPVPVPWLRDEGDRIEDDRAWAALDGDR